MKRLPVGLVASKNLKTVDGEPRQVLRTFDMDVVVTIDRPVLGAKVFFRKDGTLYTMSKKWRHETTDE